MRILLLQRGSSYMIDHTLGDANNSTSAGTESPTKIDLFHVGKEASVQSSRFAIVRQTDEHDGTGSPEYRQYGVILPPVRFDYSHHPSPTKRISVAVDESAGSSGIFEPFFLSPTAYLRLAGSHLRMGVQIGSHRLQPLSGHLDIGIEQHHILGLHLPEGKIVPICKTMIPIQQNPAYRGKLAAQHLHKTLQTAREGVLVHHSLLVLVAEQQVCGHVLAEEGGVVAGNDGKHHVLAKARVHAKVLVKPGLEGAQQRFGLHGIVGLACAHRGRAHLRKQKIAAGIQCTELCAVLALHQDLYKVPGDAQHLLDLGHHAVAEQVCLLRLGGVHGLLCHQKHVGIICHCPLHGGNALFAAHLKVDEIVGEHHQPAQGDGGQMQLFALHLDGNFFTHSANTSRLPRTFPRRQRCMQEILSLK